MKILLSAYACEPNKGSEPEVGWKWATTLAKLNHEVYVVTRSNNKENIENYLKTNEITNLNFIYFDYPDWVLKIIKGKSNPFSYFYFLLWQIGIFFAVKPFIDKIKFDFIHHVTFVSFRFPSLLCLYKIPFIFGPIAGGETIPNNLRKKLPLATKFKELLRDVSNYYVKISPLINLNFYKSYKIFVTSEESKRLIPLRYHYKTKILLAIGMENIVQKNIEFNKNSDKFNIIYAGILEPRKGISILLETFRLIKKKNNNAILNIVGSGSMLPAMQKKAIETNINESINWFGQINKDEVLNLFNKNDLLLAPFLRDSGGFVILEAMSTALPVVTLKIGGPGEIVDKECGILIDVDNKVEKEIVSELVLEIDNLIQNKEELHYKKEKSLKKIKEFSWEKKVLLVYPQNININN
jgi:glycosyltransferase involved in cell wall biosynthesis